MFLRKLDVSVAASYLWYALADNNLTLLAIIYPPLPMHNYPQYSTIIWFYKNHSRRVKWETRLFLLKQWWLSA